MHSRITGRHQQQVEEWDAEDGGCALCMSDRLEKKKIF